LCNCIGLFSVCTIYTSSLYTFNYFDVCVSYNNIDCIYSLVDNAYDTDIPVMEIDGVELTAEAEHE